jgi:hypothetical protein
MNGQPPTEDFEQAVFDILWEWLDRAEFVAKETSQTVARTLAISLTQVELRHKEVSNGRNRQHS